MSEKWTKGPWELGFEAEGDSDSDESGRSIGWYTGGEVFSGEIVTARNENGEQDLIADNVLERDAHLISAAPDLYDALRVVENVIPESPYRDIIRAALKKARGEA